MDTYSYLYAVTLNEEFNTRFETPAFQHRVSFFARLARRNKQTAAGERRTSLTNRAPERVYAAW